jgi:hypothetical protein
VHNFLCAGFLCRVENVQAKNVLDCALVHLDERSILNERSVFKLNIHVDERSVLINEGNFFSSDESYLYAAEVWVVAHPQHHST